MKTLKIELYDYDSVKKLVFSFFKNKGNKKIQSKKLLNTIVNANDYIHINKKMTIQEIINYLENKQKFWAYCNIYCGKDLRQIHYWFAKDKDIKIYDIATVFAHELAHAIGINSEETANKYAAVSNYALMILRKHFRKKLLQSEV